MLDALLYTLDAETDTLDRLAASADAQLAALREGALDRFEEAGHQTAEATMALGRLAFDRQRQHDALTHALGLPSGASLESIASALPDADSERLHIVRDRVRSAATLADARCDALAFALHYAVELGRETIHAWHGLGSDRPARVYTAAGASVAPPSGRALLDHAG